MSIKSYTYIIGWPNLGAWYYGVRTANKVEARLDFWSNYFTSSKYVKLFRKENGEPPVKIIHREFDNPEDAKKFERNFMISARISENPHWLNKYIPDEKFTTSGPMDEKTKAKISYKANMRAMFGKNKAGYNSAILEEKRKKKSAAAKKYWESGLTENHKKSISYSHTGKNVSTETRKKLSETSIARESRVLICPHCAKTGKGRVMFRWHFDSCSKK